MANKMTEAEFARRAYQISARCHEWARDCIMYPEWFERPMHEEPVGRFVASIRALLEQLEKDAGRLALQEAGQSQAPENLRGP